MSIQRVEKLHLWTIGDSSVGISGDSANVSAPGWLVSSEDYEPEGYKATLEEFREKVRVAFEVIWPNEKVYAQYDFELREEDAALDVAAD
jgi:hypothetical protein